MLLEAEDDLEVVAEAGDLDGTRRYVLSHRPTVLVLDLNMPGGSSLEAIPEVAGMSPGTSVVVLTMQEDPAFARAALRAGARAYVLKQAASAELVQAIRAAAEGGTWLNPELGARMAAAPPDPEWPPGDLTDREGDVLRLIALGHTNSEMADQLNLSVRTVETHRANIQRKLGLSTRAELVRFAFENDLVKC
jgi:two-component system response regulator NreC